MDKNVRVGIDLDGVIIDHRGHKCALARTHGCLLEPWQANSNVMRGHVTEEIYRSIQEPLYCEWTLKAPAVEGALKELARLKDRAFIVSARHTASIRFAQDWLLANGVYDLVPAERIFFCGGDAEKRGYCEKLGIGVFLDDKISVLDALPYPIKKVLFDQDGVAGKISVAEHIDVVRDWKSFLKIVNSRS
ncbi:MAG: hypothetical protein AAB692_00230 [Patescibacteria group bacterium]